MLSKDSSLETAKNTADNLYQLMELINSNIIDMDIEQIISLSGLCLDLSAQVSMWMDSEFERRENNVIETYRRRILKAALLRHQRKTGSNCLVIKLNKGGINTVELTEILLDGLLRKFERLAISEYGNVEGLKAIKGIYSSAVDVNGSGEFLTDSGKELIDELISELVEFVKKQKVEAPKTEGHEMGGSDGTYSDTNS